MNIYSVFALMRNQNNTCTDTLNDAVLMDQS